MQGTTHGMTFEQALAFYAEVTRDKDMKAMRHLALTDLFFLLSVVLGRADACRPWVYDRCQDVQRRPNDVLRLWAREHYKSTICTFALTIQKILRNPDETVCILSHTRPIAKGFLAQIMREFESNESLKGLFPDVLYREPANESPRWSLDLGIIVKRKGNPKESTVEAWGLVDGQPTSKHFSDLDYDDVVTKESVSTPEQIAKTTEAWELSLNLGADGGSKRYEGTPYHQSDTYATMQKRGIAVEIQPATVDGMPDGEPVLISREALDEKRTLMGPYTFSCHAAGTLITMLDFSHKPIENIVPGDVVIGWEFGKGNRDKARIVRTEVLAVNSRLSTTVESVLSNGDLIVHTPDHKWWTGRAPSSKDKRHLYSPIGFGYGQQNGICQAWNVGRVTGGLTREQERASCYLAGFFDADGTVLGKRGSLAFCQDTQINSHICARIESALNIMGFDWHLSQTKRTNRAGMAGLYCLKGGREAKMRFLHVTRGLLAKDWQVESSILRAGTRNFGKGSRVSLVAQRDAGVRTVYNIQTATGNYIAGGYCSKNCQMLLRPNAVGSMGFRKDWLSFYTRAPERSQVNVYITVDPASKKKKASDYTAMLVHGLGGDGNYYLLDGLRDRMNLSERTDALFRLVTKWRPISVGYEEYGLQADIEHVRYVMEQRNFRFNIVPLGGKVSKEDRIMGLIPIYKSGRMWLPMRLTFVDVEGQSRDLVKLYLDDEYEMFPVCTHDDLLDDHARILSPQLGTFFPAVTQDVSYRVCNDRGVTQANGEYDVLRGLVPAMA